MKYLFLVLSFCFGNAYALCDTMFAYGHPVITQTHTVETCSLAYDNVYDEDSKSVVYSAELLTAKNLSSVRTKRVNAFKPNPNIPTQFSAQNSDYEGAGYDKGHVAPFDDMGYNSVAGLQSFYLSNMFPQNPNNNRGIWKQIESFTRDLGFKTDVYVISGVIIEPGFKTIGNNIPVPQKAYKIILDKKNNFVYSYMVQNKSYSSNTKVTDMKVDYQFIEKLTGITFFPECNQKCLLTQK